MIIDRALEHAVNRQVKEFTGVSGFLIVSIGFMKDHRDHENPKGF